MAQVKINVRALKLVLDGGQVCACVYVCVGGSFTLYVLVDYILQPVESLHDPDSVASFVPFKLSLR